VVLVRFLAVQETVIQILEVLPGGRRMAAQASCWSRERACRVARSKPANCL